MRYGAIKKQAVTLPEGGYCLMLGQMESLLAPLATLATPLGSRVSLFAAAFLAATLIALGSDRCKKTIDADRPPATLRGAGDDPRVVAPGGRYIVRCRGMAEAQLGGPYRLADCRSVRTLPAGGARRDSLNAFFHDTPGPDKHLPQNRTGYLLLPRTTHLLLTKYAKTTCATKPLPVKVCPCPRQAPAHDQTR